MNKFSENTVPILTGRGLSETRERIERAFEKMREGSSRKEVLKTVEQSALCKDESEYTPTDAEEKRNAHFLRHANRLTLSALESAHVMSETTKGFRQHSYYVGELDKQPLAEDLFVEAAREPTKTESKRKRSS